MPDLALHLLQQSRDRSEEGVILFDEDVAALAKHRETRAENMRRKVASIRGRAVEVVFGRDDKCRPAMLARLRVKMIDDLCDHAGKSARPVGVASIDLVAGFGRQHAAEPQLVLDRGDPQVSGGAGIKGGAPDRNLPCRAGK